MSRGSIRRRGKASWELKFDVPSASENGGRKTRYVTVRGKRQDAQRELTRLLGQADAGTLVEPSKITVAQYLRAWLGGPAGAETALPSPAGLTPKTAERYRELAEGQIIPHLGAITLQKLRPAKVAEWHAEILKSGSRKGQPLAARTVGHAHRVLHRALERAVETEVLSRNVAAAVSPPKVENAEIEIIDEAQIADALHKLDGHPLHAIAITGLASGMRRGELLALRLLVDVDLDGATLRVERSLEETKAGLRFKAPKTVHGRRSITISQSAVAVLREHRRQLLEVRLALGLGKPDGNTLLFSQADGSPMRPNQLSWLWRSACKSLKLPRVSFHALRHTHASALIAGGLDVVAVSRRLGHANPTVTLNIYGHLFKKDDSAAAAVIEAMLRTPRER
jgi:integrase